MLKLLFILLLIPNTWSQVVPEDKTSLDQEYDISGLYKLNKNQQLYFRAALIPQQEQFDRKEAELSYRYSLHRNWRIGLGVRRSYGLRHNEDWTKDSGVWGWTDTSSRSENLTTLMIQHKQIAWGKGKGILKNRVTLLHNWFNDQDTLQYKVGILNFHINHWTTIHQLELAIPLNYNRSPISEIWHYSAFMYQFSTKVKFGPKITIGKMFWNESIDFNSREGNEFTQGTLIYRFGLGILFTL